MKNSFKKTAFYFLLALFSVNFSSILVSAQGTPSGSAATANYQFLAPLTGTGVKETTNLAEYIPGIITFTIGIAAVLAFVMITYGGILYATTDAISSKSQGREYITNAIYGLLLVLASYLILWTINPDTLKFNLNIPTPSITGAGGVAGGGGISAGGVGCQGICSYSYVNGSGVTVNYKDCVSCSTYDKFNLNFKTKTVDGKTVQINTTLGNNLENIQLALGPGSFTISESWPPTVNHKAQGQYDGTSVDVSLSGPTPAKINQFLNNTGSNIRAVYEVGNETIRQQYISSGVPASSIIVVPYVTGEHFSIYMK